LNETSAWPRKSRNESAVPSTDRRMYHAVYATRRLCPDSLGTFSIESISRWCLMLLPARSSWHRRRNRQSLAGAATPTCCSRSGVNGNFAENAALFIAGSALLELATANGPALKIMCAVFVPRPPQPRHRRSIAKDGQHFSSCPGIVRDRRRRHGRLGARPEYVGLPLLG